MYLGRSQAGNMLGNVSTVTRAHVAPLIGVAFLELGDCQSQRPDHLFVCLCHCFSFFQN